ncbi:MAG: hypothetical protein WBN97_07130 [Parvibaculum sp.]
MTAKKAPTLNRTASGKIATNKDKDVEQFRKAATTWEKNATRSKASARMALVRLGMLTSDGKLSKTYGG